MAGKEPRFTKSPYFVDEPGNWHLKPGAPDDIVQEFEEFMADDESTDVEEIKTIDAKELLK